jgi:predicted RNase H-like HicB family nuclease
MENAMKYFALLDGQPGNFGVVVPDLPGCTSAGKTMDAAYRNAIEAVRLWIEDALEDGEKLPRPRSPFDLMKNADVRASLAAGAAFFLVPVLRDTGRATRANISLDAGTLEALDDDARMHRLSRSAYIASATIEKIKRGT